MIQLASIIVSHAEKESQPTQRVNKKMHLLTDCLISAVYDGEKTMAKLLERFLQLLKFEIVYHSGEARIPEYH